MSDGSAIWGPIWPASSSSLLDPGWWAHLFQVILCPLLDPLLLLGHDWALVVMAVLEALCVVLVRRFTTDQAELHRLAHDRTMQKHLYVVARLIGDQAAAARHQALRTTVALRGIRHEGLPLLITVPTVLILAAWCFLRLPSEPAPAGTAITVAFYDNRLSRAAGEDRVVDLEVPPGVTLDGGPVRVLRPVTDPAETLGLPPYSEAVWTLTAPATTTPLTLRFHDGGTVLEHPLLAGGAFTPPTVLTHPGSPHATTEIRLPVYHPFGFIPGGGPFPPWMVAYLLVIVPFFFIWKRVLRVA